MEEGYTRLPASHLLGSVPAVIAEDRITSASNQAFSGNFGRSPLTTGGYQNLSLRSPTSRSPTIAVEQATTSWQGVFSISSYRPYFNIDSDVVADRIISSVYPMSDFYRKIDYNPDLYGPIWISATLIVLLATLGNVGTYLVRKGNDPSTTWMFDVSYIDWAACIIFGYAIAVPAVFYFLFYYFGSATSLLRLWCMWGYSLFIFLPTCLLLVVPHESFRWIITLLAGTASSWFIAVNLKAHTQASDLMTLVISAMALQFALALFVKIFFFPFFEIGRILPYAGHLDICAVFCSVLVPSCGVFFVSCLDKFLFAHFCQEVPNHFRILILYDIVFSIVADF